MAREVEQLLAQPYSNNEVARNYDSPWWNPWYRLRLGLEQRAGGGDRFGTRGSIAVGSCKHSPLPLLLLQLSLVVACLQYGAR